MEKISSLLSGKRVCILGFGREGRSTLKWLFRHYRQQVHTVTVADKNPAITRENNPELEGCHIITGENYLSTVNQCDIIIKSPGVNLVSSGVVIPAEKITSQTDLFLRQFHRQCLGVTGTKGKSTTASMIYDMLCRCGRKAILTGNMGKPPLDSWEQVTPQTVMVCELSSHQLEHITTAPAVAVLLNLFQEHLDHYSSFEDYQRAKFRIAALQQEGDVIITHYEDMIIKTMLESLQGVRKVRYFSWAPPRVAGMGVDGARILWRDAEKEQVVTYTHRAAHLKGKHNVMNFMAAALAAMETGCPLSMLGKTLEAFKGLDHRLQYVGSFRGVNFYNDAIATVPEASMAAVEALKNTGTLILGGQDRGVDYQPFAQFLSNQPIENYVFMGEAGKRMLEALKSCSKRIIHNILFTEDLAQAVQFALENTPRGKSCVLSPAAPSYDAFRDYAHKGQVFKELLEMNG